MWSYIINRFNIAYFMAIYCAVIAIINIEEVDTDSVSENQIYNDMIMLLDGKGAYGIISYSHFPNGSGYILLPFLFLFKLSKTQLRFLPVVLFALSSFYFFKIISSKLKFRSDYLLIGIFGYTIFQPGIKNWIGSIYSYSYYFSLALVSFALILSGNRYKLSLLGLVGFLLGWLGYDFFFLIFMALLALMIFEEETFKKRVTPALSYAFGFLCAVLAHLVQNILFYNDWKIAFNDLIGAALVRMNIDLGAHLSPKYYNWINSLIVGKEVNPYIAFSEVWQSWQTRFRWYLPEWPMIVGFTLVLWCLISLRSNSIDLRQVYKLTIAIVIELAGLLLWFIIMPKHAFFHGHFLPRHFLLMVIVFYISIVQFSYSIRKK